MPGGQLKRISPIRPTRGHTAISPTKRLIRDAFAVRERLGDRRVVPSFHWPFLPGMPPSMSPGRSEFVILQTNDSYFGLRHYLNDSALRVSDRKFDSKTNPLRAFSAPQTFDRSIGLAKDPTVRQWLLAMRG